MPAEDDYGRRHSLLQHTAVSPTPSGVADRYQTVSSPDCTPQDSAATSNDKTVQSVERLEPPERFATERCSSDRLPSGERYQGISERYPLGDRSKTAISTERLVPGHCHSNQSDRFQNPDKSHKYTSIQNIGSLDRYHNHTPVDRFSRTNTPTDRYTLYSDKEKCVSNIDRYTTAANDSTFVVSQSSLGRNTPTERHRREQYFSNSASQTFTAESYQRRDRSRSSERRTIENFQHQQHLGPEGHDAYSTDRFPAIPCPERFATQERSERPERISFTQVPYIAPPSPAPASDRFIPPPPLSPTNTPSPDCYASNAFPSPTNAVGAPERFVPPPPLSPSPTETFSPKKQRYTSSSNPNDRYAHYHHLQDRYNQFYCAPHTDRFVNTQDRFVNSERIAVSTNPHAPVERYTPQPQEPYYPYDRYHKYCTNNLGDPYTRRDLTYQHQLRMSVPFQQASFPRIRYIATPNRVKCCPYQECYQLCKTSPCSSSSSSVTSQGKENLKEISSNNTVQEVCQNGYQQEKSIQCNNFHTKDIQCTGFTITTRVDKKDITCGGYISPNLRTGKSQCRHGVCASPSVEYVGQSGGRHVCATPPPRGSVGSVDASICSDQCCLRRTQNTLAVTVWRATPTPQQQLSQSSLQQSSQSQSSTQDTCSTKSPSPPNVVDTFEQQTKENETEQSEHSPVTKAQSVQRAISLPPSVSETYRTLPPIERRLDYSQSERLPTRPKLERSISRKDAIKNFIKKETATFFGIEENNQDDEQLRWLDRRKRLASRTYGPLKEEYRPSSTLAYRRTLAELGGSQTTSERLRAFRPDVLPEPSDVPDTVEERWPSPSIRRKDSVARLTWNGLSYVVTTLTRHRPRPRSQTLQFSRSFSPGVGGEAEQNLEDDVFFEQPLTSPSSPVIQDSTDAPENREQESAVLEPLEHQIRYTAMPGWKRDLQHVVRTRAEHRREVGGNRIFSSLLDNVLDNSDRRQYGMGWVGRMFGRSMRSSVMQEQDIKEQLNDMEDNRPMFTYWVSTVQVLVLIISLICYGFGPFGIDLQLRSSQVLVPNLALQQVDYLEPAHFWFGPRAADLIHLGAKFAPCMRVDDTIQQEIEKTRKKEKETACCIRNDDSGCVQSSRADCSNTISTWKKWTPRDAGPGGRISGSVCGLDPKYCDAPASVHPYEWPDDITKWPICRKTNTRFSVQKHNGSKDKSAEHMICEVIGHPCCVGIHGVCKITTREYCDFVRGNFHEDASLCSQVSCLDNVCGMIPFYFPEVPDQFYRLWTSLFLHAGILQLFLTLVIQYFLMRDLEKLTGSLRIAIIYLGSGMAGNLASAIFVPYRADVGPSGSHFGLLACLIVEVLNAWPMLKHPNKALGKLLSITFSLFLVGLMPWVDNYSHLFGFVFGFLLSYALLPFITFGPYDRQKKVILIWVCLLSAAFLFICLILLFYIIPVYNCEVCSYFNCLPITREFCASQNINFKREEYTV